MSVSSHLAANVVGFLLLIKCLLLLLLLSNVLHVIWDQIMGVGYDRSLTQWSKGEYTGANNLVRTAANIMA
jgi:hypothetical protein